MPLRNLLLLFSIGLCFPTSLQALDGPQGFKQYILTDPNQPGVVFLEGGENSISYTYRSTDYGQTWIRTVTTLPTSWEVQISDYDPPDPMDPPLLLAATQRFGVKRSTDWIGWDNTSGLTGPVRSIAIHPYGNIAYATATTYVFPAGDSDEDIYWSQDAGVTWQLFNDSLGFGVADILLDPGNPQILYVSKYGQGVYRSLDAGVTWVLGNTGLTDLTIRNIFMDPANSSILFAATFTGLFQSVDGGATWSDSGLQGESVRDIAIDPTNSSFVLAATSGNGVFRSVDGGQTWIGNQTGLPSETFVAVDMAPDGSGNVYALSGTGNYSFYRSSDSGMSWIQVSEDPPSPPPPPPILTTQLEIFLTNESADKPQKGEQVVVDVFVKNIGANPADDVVVHLTRQSILNGNFSDGNVGGTWNGDSCPFSGCEVGTIAPGEQVRVRARAFVTTNGTEAVWIRADANGSHVYPPPDFATITISVNGGSSGSVDLGLILLLVLILLPLARFRWHRCN